MLNLIVLEHGRERGRMPFSFPLHLSMVDEVLVKDLVGNGLDDKIYGLVMEKGHIVESPKKVKYELCKES